MGWRGIFFALVFSTFIGWLTFSPPAAAAEDVGFSSYIPTVENGSLVPARTPRQVATVLQTVALLTFLTLAPSLLILLTCFTRIVVVLGFLRRALATQTLPPDQVLVGLSLFLTLFIMTPTWETAWKDGLRPYLEGEQVDGQAMTQEEAFRRVLAPQRNFMFSCLTANEGTDEVLFFMETSGHKRVEKDAVYYLGEDDRKVKLSELELRDIPTLVLIPAFVTSELKRSFWMGFLLYLPFLVLDLVVSSILMSMGMMMLPPVMISLPFKIILFVLVDGWNLVMKGLVMSFPAEISTVATG